MLDPFRPTTDWQYFAWLEKNPDGFVVNSTPSPSSYFVVHRATCRSISRYQAEHGRGAFTERAYRKSCGQTIEALVETAFGPERAGVTYCGQCDPRDAKPLSAHERGKFAQRAAAAATECRTQDPSEGRAMPERYVRAVTEFVRDPKVVAAALVRSDGHCERCRSAAPFLRASDGSPYLEVHHITPLSDGGPDTQDNVLALCPNCHRELHFGPRP